MKIGASLSHQDQVTLLYEEEVKKLEQQNVTLRYYALPDINIATNEAYNDLRQMHDEVIICAISSACGAKIQTVQPIPRFSQL